MLILKPNCECCDVDLPSSANDARICTFECTFCADCATDGGGDSYDALAESVIGLFKTEVINFLGPWKSTAQVEWETLKWVDWFNNRRLLQPIGNIPPAEAVDKFYAQCTGFDKVA